MRESIKTFNRKQALNKNITFIQGNYFHDKF